MHQAPPTPPETDEKANRAGELSKWIGPALAILAGLLAAAVLPALAGRGPFSWMDLALAAALVALLSVSPIPISGGEAVLAHSVSVAVALAAGPVEAALGLIIGLVVGTVVCSRIDRRAFDGSRPAAALRELALDGGQHLVALAAGLVAYRASGGPIPLAAGPQPPLGALLALAAGFLVPFTAIQSLRRLGSTGAAPRRRDVLAFVVLVGTIPLPYAIFTAAAAQTLGHTAFLVLGGGPAIVAPVVRSLMLAERDLERKVGELSTLSEVSQAMRTSLNLEAILHTIYLQVAHLLNVRNFYVALIDETGERLRYPLAIKAGSRAHWPNRAVSDRLTDRVIRNNEPILIPHDAPQALREMGLPELRNAPESWLGVPLQSANKVLGCIGVFHLKRGGTFSVADRDVLVTLAGQASVAIENALLYEQTSQRAQALASLNEITTQMSSSLDPEQTLQLVARSLTRVVGGDKAAIYLTSPDGSRLDLVQSIGLSESLQRLLSSMPLDQPAWAAAYHRRKPTLYPNVQDRNLPSEVVQAMSADGISGSVDVPLSTPSGTLGMASVFFMRPMILEDEQLGLLEVFVAQSAIAVANARAHAETDQALKRQVQQLSRLESIGREMVSTLDPDALFESILDSAMNATGAHIGHLAIMDPSGQTLRLAAGRGYQGLPQGEPGGTVPNSAFGLSTKAIQDGHVLMVQDVRRSPEHVDWTGGRGRSLLAVPIARLGRPLGVITVESEETAAFGDEQARFLTQVASYAAVAITNAGLYQQLEDNLREQSLLYQASAQIATSMDTQAVAMAVADSLAVALGAVNVTVFAPDPLKDGFAVLATAANGQVAGGEASEVAEADELSACLDRGMPLHFERTVNGDHRSAMAIPLSVGAEPIGVVEIQQDAPHAFGEAELRTAQTIAAQAAIALQNSDLFRRIQESHDRLSAVLNSTKEAILLVDRGGDVRLTNRQFETMLSEQEAQLVGAPLLAGPGELAEKLGFPSQAGQSPDSILNDAVDPVDLHIDTPQERVLRRSVQPVQEADGEPIGWLVVLRDITEEQELAEAREQLTEMIVHDLRSPLTTILGSLSLIEREIPETDRPQVTSQALNVSRRSVDQMLGLVNSLLDLARLEASPLELELAPLAIDQLVGELSESFVPEANQAGLILDVAVGTSIPTVEADRDKVRRVLGNLLDNAIKFTPEGGRIEIGIQAHDGLVQVKVADSGPGVPADMRERIFDRFAQVPGRTGRRRGTGLGLAFAKLAIEAHGGRIWVEDNHPSGSAFCVELPIDQDETALTKDR